jgi:hypothetical protein
MTATAVRIEEETIDGADLANFLRVADHFIDKATASLKEAATEAAGSIVAEEILRALEDLHDVRRRVGRCSAASRALANGDMPLRRLQ